jgi:hypothetical protein
MAESSLAIFGIANLNNLPAKNNTIGRYKWQLPATRIPSSSCFNLDNATDCKGVKCLGGGLPVRHLPPISDP